MSDGKVEGESTESTSNEDVLARAEERSSLTGTTLQSSPLCR